MAIYIDNIFITKANMGKINNLKDGFLIIFK